MASFEFRVLSNLRTLLATALLASSAIAQDFSFTTVLETTDVQLPVGALGLFDESGFAGDGFTSLALDLNQNFRPIDFYDVRSGQAPAVISTGGFSEPTSSDPLTILLNPHGNGTTTSFFAVATDNMGNTTTRGIYLNQSPNSFFETVAVTGQTLPGRTGTVTGVSAPVLADGELAFSFITDGDLPTEHRAIVTRPINPAGPVTLTTLVDTNTAVPNQDLNTFLELGFSSKGYDGNRAVFLGTYESGGIFSEGQGIYSVEPGNAPTLVLEGGADLPGNVIGTQYSLSTPLVDGENTVFVSSRFANSGIFLANDTGILPIVDSATPLPQDANETFDGPFSFYAVDDGRVAFHGRGSDQSSGVYLYDQGEIIPVLTTLDTIDSFPVALADISRNGLRGDQLLLDVVLSDEENMLPISQVVLVDILPDNQLGDFDFDGDVDGNDFLQWQSDSGVGNLADWQLNYGTSVSPLSGSVAVPEPTGILLLVGITLLGSISRRC